MEIRVQKNGKAATVAIEGEMNIYHAMELKAAVMDAVDEAEAIEFDLSAVSEFDSVGVQILLLAKREAASGNKPFNLKASSAPVASVVRLFNLSGLLCAGAEKGE